MKITEAIILAGGLGMRLRSAMPDLPKCMAPVNGKPFIIYVMQHLIEQGVGRFILSLGYRHEMVIKYFESVENKFMLHYSSPVIEYAIEEESLGTGGAIKHACAFTKEKNILVANGDTLFKVDAMKLAAFHHLNNADCTLSLKPMENFSRYGMVELNNDYSIKDFKEKQFYKNGLINGGLYVLDVDSFLQEDIHTKFSFEKDYLEKLYEQRKIYGIVQDEYFIDIGIPEDYEKAKAELR
jgi:D-glycero-alpha-D-manno-heptose 1-phosphate guanylyltransferase